MQKHNAALWKTGGEVFAIASVIIFAFAGCKEQDKGAAKPARKTAASPAVKPGKDPRIEAARHAIPDGQVLLADDPAFTTEKGWSTVELNSGGDPPVTSWTLGDAQFVDWEGPEKPGQYELTVKFWRHHPFPTKELAMEYKLPGDADWQKKDAPVGPVTLEKVITVAAPKEKLHMEFKIPSWVPELAIPGSGDPRKIGFMFAGAELRPKQ